MKKVVVSLIIVFGFAINGLAEDYKKEPAIWIEPGISIGAIRLGYKTLDVMSKMGIPQDINDYEYVNFFKYPSMDIRLSIAPSMIRAAKKKIQGKKSKEEIEFEVNQITTYSPFAKTRGKLSVGSSFKEVLDVFGDTFMTISSEPIKTIECANILSFKFPENNRFELRKGIFTGYVLTLNYFNEGIQFHFRIDGDNSNLRVFAISIWEKRECEVKLELGDLNTKSP